MPEHAAPRGAALTGSPAVQADAPARPGAPRARGRLLFVVTEDWYFRSHRLGLARAAREAGYEVWVATRCGRYGAALREAGLQVVDIPFSRSFRRPWRDAASILALLRCMRRVRPDIVHNVALKPVLLGTLAALLAGVPRVVNAVTGLGYVFTNAEHRLGPLRRAVALALGGLMRRRRCHTIVQNADDRALLAAMGLTHPDRTSLIPGAGVEPEAFTVEADPGHSPPAVVLVARALYDKGLREFAEAAQRLAARGVEASFLLVGDPDPENPAAVSAADMQRWSALPMLECLGRRDDVPAILARAQIACLPSYREGFPKALLEAAAAGLPLVATDVPGCREICVDGDNGRLVPPRDAGALAEALAALCADPHERRRMGARSRAKAGEFALSRIAAATFALYDSLAAQAAEPPGQHRAAGKGRHQGE